MKISTAFRSLLIYCGSSLLSSLSANATILYYDGGTVNIAGNGNSAASAITGNWNTAISNWDAGAVPYVGWNNTKITDGARWAVDFWLVGFTNTWLGETRPSIGGRNHRQASLIELGHRNFRSARIVGANVRHHVGIAACEVRICNFLFDCPLACCCRSIIEIEIFQAVGFCFAC